MSIGQTGLELSEDRTRAIAYHGNDEVVSLPDSITSLPEGLFAHCTALKSVKLPTGIKILPERLFDGCTQLVRVRLPHEVHSVGARCFAMCSSLTSAPLCPGMTEIAEDMFRGCTSLESLDVPDGIKIIRKGAFAGCTTLSTLILSASVNKIEEGAFDGCTALRYMRVVDGNPAYYIEETDGLLRSKSDGEIVVPFDKPNEAKAAGMLHNESESALNEEIDLTPDIDEDANWGMGGQETLEEIDNNFIGDEDEATGSTVHNTDAADNNTDIADNNTDHADKKDVAPATAEVGKNSAEETAPVAAEITPAITASGTVEERGRETAETGIVKEAAEDVQEKEDTRTSIGQRGMLPITDRGAVAAAENANMAIERVKTETIAASTEVETIRKAVEDASEAGKDAKAGGDKSEEIKDMSNVEETAPAGPSIADILSQNIMNRETKDTEESAASSSAGEAELGRIALENDILSQNLTDGARVAAAGKDELNRIAMEHDILSQNLTGGAEEASAKNDELHRIVMENDILSQNTRTEGSDVGAGMDELLLLSKESEILRDNTKVSNHITLTPTEAVAKVEGEEIDTVDTPIIVQGESGEEAVPIPPSSETSQDKGDKDIILERVKNSAQKYECIDAGKETSEALFVFAEKLITNAAGDGKFSPALIRCCKYLAATHALGKIHLFYGLPFDHMEFMQMFRQFIFGKNAVYACDADNTKGLSSLARAFASSANIRLTNDAMAEQRDRASTKGGLSFRLILQDDYKE